MILSKNLDLNFYTPVNLKKVAPAYAAIWEFMDRGVSMIGIMEPPIFAVMEPVKRVEKGSSDPPFQSGDLSSFRRLFF